MTKQQALILDIMLHANHHLSAEDVYLIAKKRLSSIAIGTVYRNLNILAAQGDIRRVEVPGSPVYYDKNISVHNHLYCDVCNELQDIMIKGLHAFLEDKTEVNITSVDLIIHHVCDKCK